MDGDPSTASKRTIPPSKEAIMAVAKAAAIEKNASPFIMAFIEQLPVATTWESRIEASLLEAVTSIEPFFADPDDDDGTSPYPLISTGSGRASTTDSGTGVSAPPPTHFIYEQWHADTPMSRAAWLPEPLPEDADAALRNAAKIKAADRFAADTAIVLVLLGRYRVLGFRKTAEPMTQANFLGADAETRKRYVRLASFSHAELGHLHRPTTAAQFGCAASTYDEAAHMKNREVYTSDKRRRLLPIFDFRFILRSFEILESARKSSTTLKAAAIESPAMPAPPAKPKRKKAAATAAAPAPAAAAPTPAKSAHMTAAEAQTAYDEWRTPSEEVLRLFCAQEVERPPWQMTTTTHQLTAAVTPPVEWQDLGMQWPMDRIEQPRAHVAALSRAVFYMDARSWQGAIDELVAYNCDDLLDRLTQAATIPGKETILVADSDLVVLAAAAMVASRPPAMMSTIMAGAIGATGAMQPGDIVPAIEGIFAPDNKARYEKTLVKAAHAQLISTVLMDAARPVLTRLAAAASPATRLNASSSH